MKILILSRWLVSWNGMSRVAFEIAKHLMHKFDVRIISYEGYVNKDWEKEIEIIKIKKNPKDLSSLIDIRNIILREEPDVIHSHGVLGLSAFLAKYPYMVTFHGNWPHEWLLGVRYFVSALTLAQLMVIEMKKAFKVISVSNFSKKVLKEIYGIESTVIYNGISEQFFQTPSNYVELRHPAIIFVGGIDKRKSKYLYKIVNHLPKDIYLYVIGKILDKNLAKKLQKKTNVVLLGPCKDIKRYLYSADIFILPSLAENFPLTVLEAQACGLPVVAFNVGGIKEAVLDNKTGFLVSPRDTDVFTQSILKIAYDEKLRRTMSYNARKWAERFKWNNIIKLYIRAYYDMLRLTK